jgi:hypothetical protein
MNKRRKISLSLALIIIFSFLTACGGNKSIEEKLIDGGIWLAQGKWSSYLMVFTPEGKVLYGGDFQAIFEIEDSVLKISSPQGDYVTEYAISVSEDGNTIFLNTSFVDGSDNTVVETTTLTHYSEYKPVSLSSLKLENSFWATGNDDGVMADGQSNAEDMGIYAFTDDELALFAVLEEYDYSALIYSIDDFTITDDAIFTTVHGDMTKFSVSVFNKDIIVLSIGDQDGPFILQRMKPDVVEKFFPTAPDKNKDEIINGLTSGVWIMPEEGNGGIAFLPDGTFIDGDTLELGTYEVLAQKDSLYMNLSSEDGWGDWEDILTITETGKNTVVLGGLQLTKYVPYEATDINKVDFSGNWHLFEELFITPEYQSQAGGAELISGDILHVVGNSVILGPWDGFINFTAYPFSGDIIYLHSPVPGYNVFLVRASN